MKLSKILGVAAVAALALMALASTASATTLEVGGVTQTKAVEIKASLEPGTSLTLVDTSGAFANTCTGSSEAGSDTTAVTGTTVSGPISTLSFSSCTHEKVVVDKPGTLSIERIGTTTNGTVRSNGAEVTVPVTLFGFIVTVDCKTENTDLGIVTGVREFYAKYDLNAVVNCGTSLPSARWQAVYLITTPFGIGVTG